MKLAKVIKRVISTKKHHSIDGVPLLLIKPLNSKLKEEGNEIVAADTVSAGPKDIVYYTLSKESTLALKESFAPVDAVITGIVDSVDTLKTKLDKSIFIKE